MPAIGLAYLNRLLRGPDLWNFTCYDSSSRPTPRESRFEVFGLAQLLFEHVKYIYLVYY